jgi:hypothetical protein
MDDAFGIEAGGLGFQSGYQRGSTRGQADVANGKGCNPALRANLNHNTATPPAIKTLPYGPTTR